MRKEYEGIYDWNLHQGLPEPQRQPRERVEIDDETWRDGMQGTQFEEDEPQPTTEQKDYYVSIASSKGYIDHLDIGFPATSKLHRDEIVSLINSSTKRKDQVTFSVAGRAAQIDDARAIVEIAERTDVPIEADVFWDPSVIRSKVQGWDREDMLIRTAENIEFLKKEGLKVMYVPERASATPPSELLQLCRIAADSGADRLAIADTTGVLTPQGTVNIFREVFQKIGKNYPDIKFDFHEHDDLGMGLANSLVAAQEGVDRLHATARSVGERAGNVNLEKLIVLLNIRGYRDLDTSEIIKFAHLASDILRVAHPTSHEPIIGEKWPETSSGVHANTYGKMGDIPIYFPLDPKDVGLEPKVKIGATSGLSNVYLFCDSIGIHNLTEEKALEILNFAHSTGRQLSENTVRKIVGRNGHL